MKIPFLKMEGLGNDFVVVFESDVPAGWTPSADWARRACDRRFGVGADQVLWVSKGPRMDIWNADGSTAEMCGNGIRAVALELRARGAQGSELAIQTAAGVKTVSFVGSHVRVDMGVPVVKGPEVLQMPWGKFEFWDVNVGNPHAVARSADVAAVPLEQWGRDVETHGRFPQRTNVEWVQVLGPETIRLRVWERGAGATLACGTGACASAATAMLWNKTRAMSVELPGGVLQMEWAGPGQSIFMTGPARKVFAGELKD